MFIKDLNYWLLHKVLACVVFHKSEFNRVSIQELFLMWCIHNRKQVCWTYWIFHQLLSCTPRQYALLTHGHVITIIAKALNLELDDFPKVVECSYFTNQAFVRGEVVDAAGQLIPARSRSCWLGVACPSDAAVLPEDEPTADVAPPSNAPSQPSASGSSNADSQLLTQILDNQRLIQRTLHGLEASNQQMDRR